jgi:hypothetical protein
MVKQMIDFKMEIGDCPKCEKRTMVVLGAVGKGSFSLLGYCYNCKHIFDKKADIELISGDNQSAT